MIFPVFFISRRVITARRPFSYHGVRRFLKPRFIVVVCVVSLNTASPCGCTAQVVLEIKGELQLRTLAEKLAAGGISFKLWTEQPENFVTCLATKPYRKQEVAAYFKKLALAK